MNNSGPQYLKHGLQKYSKNRVLRSNDQNLLVTPRFAKARIGGRAFAVKKTTLWNSIPEQLGIRFKKPLKTWLFILP